MVHHPYTYTIGIISYISRNWLIFTFEFKSIISNIL